MSDHSKLRELCRQADPDRPDYRSSAESELRNAMSVGAVTELLDEIDNGTCHRHADRKHGAEAEELRRGVERLLDQVRHVEGHDARVVLIDFRRGIQSLLDRVDARDSLAFLESRDEKLVAKDAEIERLTVGIEKAMRDGFELAVDNAEISEHDGWHRTDPRNDWDYARKQLDERIATIRKAGQL